MEPEDLAVIGHTGDLLVDIYARNLTHIYILPQCSTTAARVLNPAGMDAQFERLRCAISCGILTLPNQIEQAKVGEFFQQLDNLITLHQRKCALLFSPFQAFISMMFTTSTFSWEQRKLASLCEKFTDGDWIESKDQSDFGVRLVQTGNVGVAEYLDKTNNKKWISEDTFDRLHCEEVLPGDILISRLPEPAGRACIVPLLGTKMITAVDCTIVRTAPDMSNKFLVQYLSSQAYFDDVNTCLAGGTRQRISRGNLANFNVPIPVKKSEQDAIGMFFGYLDNLITLHQRKCDDTKELKKYMLQKMFPKNGEKFPEIRFKGFTEAWEQRKLGEVLKERTERAKGDEELLSVTIANGVIRQIDSEKRNTASEDRSNYKIVKKGDVPYNSMRMWQGAVGNSKYNGIVSPAYTILTPTPEANGKFFMELFKKKSTLQIFQRWSQGLTSDTWNLKYPILSSIQFAIPSVEEQEKIAEYFSSLDHLITLHRRAL